MRFVLTAECTFDAIDFHDAVLRLAQHFRLMAVNESGLSGSKGCISVVTEGQFLGKAWIPGQKGEADEKLSK